jgi:hypothetical protein
MRILIMAMNTLTTTLKRRRSLLLLKLKSLEGQFLRGSLIERFKRCGKAECKCVKGKGHGPKHYLSVSFPDKNPDMIYIPQDMVPEVKRYVENYKSMKIILDKISDINREILVRREEF